MIKLNNDQQNLIKALHEFYNSDDQYFLLSGQAGVGKTTCVKYFIESLPYQELNICLSAPTNKATRVLRDSVKIEGLVYKTIYSLLGLRLAANGAIKEIQDSGKTNIGEFDIVICDEASMLKELVLTIMDRKIRLSHTKIIIIGDKEQLPPVKEIVSAIWEQYPINYELTEVMRHQNSILTFVQSIRGNPNPVFESTGKEVIIHDEDSFMEVIRKNALAGRFHSGECKAIAWRNVTVDFLNDYIRSAITKSKDEFVIGDRIVFTAPLTEGEETMASTDDEGIVKSVVVETHPMYPMFKVNKMTIMLDTGEHVVARSVHESSAVDLKAYSDDLANKKLWKSFWSLDESFAKISYGFALTTHRSQGSTFKEIFVDAGDIMMNFNVSDRKKSLYVGCSRASDFLHIFP